MSPISFIIKPLLFACGPFFVYPWKPVMNLFFGDGYAEAFKHFKYGHRGVTNLALHVVCMGIQLSANFGLLRVLDKEIVPQPIEGVRLLSAASAVAWILQLLPAPVPLPCTAGAVGAIVGSYFIAPQVPSWLEYDKIAIGTYVAVMLISNFVFAPAKKKIPAKMFVKSFAIIGALVGLGVYLQQNMAGVYADQTMNARLGLLGLLSVVSLLPYPVAKVVITGTLLGRSAAYLTGDQALFYLSYAFIASLFQGISHQSTNEEATLLALEKQGEDRTLQFDLAHVTYFPSILLHTLSEFFAGRLK